MEEQQLPEGWVWTTLGDICTIIMGQSPPSSEYNDKGEGIPFFQGKAEFTEFYPQTKKWCTSPLKIAEVNDILLSIRAPVGPTNITPTQCCIGRGLAAIRPEDAISFRYILYGIRKFNTRLTDMATGSTFEAISGEDIKIFKMPLPPLPEQQRIVAAIEEQFTRLDSAIASLRSAQARFKQYRASLLKAAVEGELTKEWRTEHLVEETGEQLLQRILIERRKHWEEQELAKMSEKGIIPKDDSWKKRYKEPQGPDISNLPELPDGWCWVTLEELSRRITDGTHQPPPFVEAGIPFIFVKHIVKGQVSFEGTKYISEGTYQILNSRCPVEVGDILYSAVGSYGVAVPVLASQPFSFQRHIAHIKPSYILNLIYLVHVLNSKLGLDQAHKFARGVAQKTVTLTDLARFAIPLPPLAEQAQIVAEVEAALSNIAKLEETTANSLKRAERERQSILREAFAGRLVEQDPADEPASILLERIRAERKKREEADKVVKLKKKGDTMKTTKRRKNAKTGSASEKLDLADALREAGRPLPPEDLFRQAGLTADERHEAVELFYDALDADEKAGRLEIIKDEAGKTLIGIGASSSALPEDDEEGEEPPAMTEEPAEATTFSEQQDPDLDQLTLWNVL